MEPTTRTNLFIFGIATLVMIGVSQILLGWIAGAWMQIMLGAVALGGAWVLVQAMGRGGSRDG